jgi:hypothetical protein
MAHNYLIDGNTVTGGEHDPRVLRDQRAAVWFVFEIPVKPGDQIAMAGSSPERRPYTVTLIRPQIDLHVTAPGFSQDFTTMHEMIDHFADNMVSGDSIDWLPDCAV